MNKTLPLFNKNVPPPIQEISKNATSKANRKQKLPKETSIQQEPSPTIVKQKRTKKGPVAETPKGKSRQKVVA